MKKLVTLTCLMLSLVTISNASTNTSGVYLKAIIHPFAYLEIMELHVDQAPLLGDLGVKFTCAKGSSDFLVNVSKTGVPSKKFETYVPPSQVNYISFQNPNSERIEIEFYPEPKKSSAEEFWKEIEHSIELADKLMEYFKKGEIKSQNTRPREITSFTFEDAKGKIDLNGFNVLSEAFISWCNG